jgi:hypothetical protein
MSSDFYTERRAIADKVVECPKPIGWRREGTYPLVSAPTGGDPFDSAPSRNPYPPMMPTPDVKGGPIDIDIHVRALRHVEHVAHDAGILVLGGDIDRTAELRTAILRRKALREELGTGVVELTEAEVRFLSHSAPPPPTGDDGFETIA